MRMFILGIITISSRLSFAQSDDFEDGDGAGWSPLDPLAQVGAAGRYSFPNANSYRLQGAASPDEGNLGPARIGALREEANYNDFYQRVDIVDYDQSLDQNFGMVARVREPGLGTLDGYSFSYNPNDQEMFFSVIDNELGDDTAVTVPLPAGTPVKMVFQGQGDSFRCELFALTDLNNPVAVIEAVDDRWDSGISGVFVVADRNDPAQPTDCTFDNYLAAAAKPQAAKPPEPVRILHENNGLVLSFIGRPDETYSVWQSSDLLNWERLIDEVSVNDPETTELRVDLPDPVNQKGFFQVRVLPRTSEN